MKRFIIVLMAVMISMGVSAQELRLGATGGLHFAWAHIDDGNSSGSYIGFQLGAKAELDLSNVVSNGFYIDGKMVYTLKGGRWATHHYNFGYLELPIAFSYRHPVSDDVSLIGGLGPYFGLGILGKSVSKADGAKLKQDIFGSMYKRFDLGLNYQAGVEMWDKWQFFLAFEHSLMNIRHIHLDEVGDYKVRPLNFYIGTAYMF